MLLIVFGLPGTGKNYICKILRRDFGFFFHDIDDDITPDLKKIISQGQIVSDEVRTKFFSKVVQNVKKMYAKKNKIVIAQALIKEEDRKLFLRNFPDAKFIFVKAKQEVINLRLNSRKHLITKDYAEKIKKIFEEPKISHYVIENSSDGEEKIKKQVHKIFN
ncbi:AAA family ATPase [Patescibacteria group bacterium]|nr:AAA family ATPase [Patescibacteria group bacterium]